MNERFHGRGFYHFQSHYDNERNSQGGLAKFGANCQLLIQSAFMRFNLKSVFLAVAMLALVFAAMRSRTALGPDLIYSLTIGMYVVAAIRAIGLQARRRVTALNFAAVGLGYLLFATMSIFGGARESLVTNYPLAYAAMALGPTVVSMPSPYVPPVPLAGPPTYAPTYLPPAISPGGPASPQPAIVRAGPSVEFLIVQGLSTDYTSTSLHCFFLIGHCVFSWIFAVLAAWFAGRMYDRREKI